MPAPDRRIPAYVDRPRLCEELCISDRTLDRWVDAGILPPPREPKGVRPTGGAYETKQLWKWKEVEDCLDGKAPAVPASGARLTEAEEITNASKNFGRRDH